MPLSASPHRLTWIAATTAVLLAAVAGDLAAQAKPAVKDLEGQLVRPRVEGTNDRADFGGLPVPEKGEVPRDLVKAAVVQGVESMLVRQNDDGTFQLMRRAGATGRSMYPFGETGLAVMTLQYARPWLEGDVRDRATAALNRGLAALTQGKPEERTYSATTVTCALFGDNPQRHARTISDCATFLIRTQLMQPNSGLWSYPVFSGAPPRDRRTRELMARMMLSAGDNSNTQFAVLGLYTAQRAGFQVPRATWDRTRKHYLHSQLEDGGWGYQKGSRQTTATMTTAGTISLYICEEMLREDDLQCSPPPRSKAIDAGLAWIVRNWDKARIGTNPYGLYALERLGIIMGRSNIGPWDWYNDGARRLLVQSMWETPASSGTDTCFAVMFLARGLEPVLVNKLERPGTDDWNNAAYDVKHLVEYLDDRYQTSGQWRIVTLEAPAELLAKTPILYISGTQALAFTEAEKDKLKAYIAGGGTILGQAVGGKKAFDKSFRALAKDLTGGALEALPVEHPVFQRMKLDDPASLVAIETVKGGPQRERTGIVYLPTDLCCRWHKGGSRAKDAFEIGAAIVLHVLNESKRPALRP